MVYIAYDPETGAVDDIAYSRVDMVPAGKSALSVTEKQWTAAFGKIKKVINGEFVTEEPPPVPVTVCTKYQLVKVLRENFPALLEQLRQAYAADLDMQFYWNTVNDLDRSNPDFQAAAEKLGITPSQLDEIFAVIAED